MTVLVEIPTILRSHTGGQRAIEAHGESLRELVTNIDRDYPGLAARLVDGDALRRFVNVYVNDEDVRFSNNLDTPLKPGDVVTILPAVAGGSFVSS